MWIFIISLSCLTQKEMGTDTSGTDLQETGTNTEPTAGEERDALVESLDAGQLPAGDNPCRSPMLLRVNHVVDGDTFYGTGDNGEEKVRVIGINTPEIGYDGDPSDCYALEAQSKARSLLNGRLVWLTFDSVCEDYYERTLAYVHFGVGEQGFFERVMLQGGFAKAFPFDDTNTFMDVFDQDESQAEASEVGAWGDCNW
jgi:micrococcal nuclease